MSEIASTGRIEIGRVLQQLFAVLSRNVGPFLGAAIVLTGLPQLVIALSGLRAAHGAGALLYVVAAVAAGVASLVLNAALVLAALTDLKGERVSIGASLRQGASKFIGVFVIALLLGLGVVVGSALLIVPGLILATMWSVAIPSYLDRRGDDFMGSLNRSAELTRGNRWRVFGVIVLGALLLFALQMVVVILAGGVAGLAVARQSLTVSLGLAVASVMSALFWSVGSASLYIELRRAKGGFGTEGLAAVFD